MIRLPVLPALHPLFETLGYTLGYAWYKRLRRLRGDAVGEGQRWSVIAAAAVGALVGSRLLGVLEQWPRIHLSLRQVLLPGGGKTIVGGLLGGWIAVELAKWAAGIRTRTGDLFAVPLCVGILVGRVGCLLAGLADDTYGKPTGLPWGCDFGDGVARHPTQAYEIVFLLGLIIVLQWIGRRPTAAPGRPWLLCSTASLPAGTLFRVFLGSYLLWRLLIDFLKPQPLVAGLNPIQWACVAGLVAVMAGGVSARVETV